MNLEVVPKYLFHKPGHSTSVGPSRVGPVGPPVAEDAAEGDSGEGLQRRVRLPQQTSVGLCGVQENQADARRAGWSWQNKVGQVFPSFLFLGCCERRLNISQLEINQ